MEQKFKFGDMLRLNNDTLAVVLNQHGSTVMVAYPFGGWGNIDIRIQPVQLIPHPDTKRLDWIVENGANIEDIDGYFKISIDPECDPHLVGNPQAIRRVIDNQMADGKYLQCHSPD